MLLGEPVLTPLPPSKEKEKESSSAAPAKKKGKESLPPRSRGLDILHATATALMDALREVLRDSDFENAMKALTSWVPIKDEEMLMRVARVEWKLHQGSGRRKA